ncbi:similar to Saccharomyces cerevisiae YDR100W TVP15 Integral membrane protein localized to late Golgi vesicles along with the v-SNARE Tlg2p [Maudiozyma barnettii]|uniref:Similar to Saccharomyces cerevisiae YDR100W TVP15 Integral membrane protein localized to late Golgi vesicles along with the v-SNARE Tlg2p n=1 Tax=Maudiozyma barnettii TaxID=61262 RepID=A0A8H2VI80_9SACH|nr:Tvp15p [Kazachstania barnettii]CAB4255719.1 similar to Saccharomyces cerevisiae YDR100W TVP15 Integral membrane protein localized to late Golgi vesicles along with the v-SNARE Tlg2p [Kazachstania barnettii]CAD1784280.1 similar to Saccharomyces cerevisiae YDR100W TVP15 Integral membrane protein localized to late Golgi vesicles along with the v-SNARE Tlg2p [Kazachstania barnettii]
MSTIVTKKGIKIANLAIGAIGSLAALSQLTYVVSDFNVFMLSLFAIPLSAMIIMMEFKVPTQLYNFASFYFSFLGRGILQILLGIMVCHGGALKLMSAFLLIISGIAYCLFQFLPMIEEPDFFKVAGSSLTVGDDEFDDDDEVI